MSYRYSAAYRASSPGNPGRIRGQAPVLPLHGARAVIRRASHGSSDSLHVHQVPPRRVPGDSLPVSCMAARPPRSKPAVACARAAVERAAAPPSSMRGGAPQVPLVIQMTDDEKFLWKGDQDNTLEKSAPVPRRPRALRLLRIFRRGRGRQGVIEPPETEGGPREARRGPRAKGALDALALRHRRLRERLRERLRGRLLRRRRRRRSRGVDGDGAPARWVEAAGAAARAGGRAAGAGDVGALLARLVQDGDRSERLCRQRGEVDAPHVLRATHRAERRELRVERGG